MKIHKEMWLTARPTKIWRGRGCCDFFLLHNVCGRMWSLD
jgi:hypothetical protein